MVQLKSQANNPLTWFLTAGIVVENKPIQENMRDRSHYGSWPSKRSLRNATEYFFGEGGWGEYK